MHCKLCDAGMAEQFKATILGKYDVTFFFCSQCGYLCTEQPYWLAESYSTAIVASDTGAVSRNVAFAKRLSAILYFLVPDRGPWLDCAGGYGTLTRLMRDYGFDFYWSDKYCENLFARGFELPEAVECVGVTALEALEHAEDPKEFIAEIMAKTAARYFIFTTETYEGAPPAPDAWWYYGLGTGQHVSYFQERTLRKLAADFGFKYLRSRNMHLFSRPTVSAYWFQALAGKLSTLLDPYVRRRLTSKIMSDHLELVRRADMPHSIGAGE